MCEREKERENAKFGMKIFHDKDVKQKQNKIVVDGEKRKKKNIRHFAINVLSLCAVRAE